MAPAGAIAAKDLRRRLRDRTAILVAVILPFALAWIFSLTLSGVDEAGFSATYVMVDEDHGDLPDSLTRALRSLDFVTLTTARDLAAGEDLVDRGEADAAFVLPEGFSDKVQAGSGGRLRVVVSPDAEVAGLVAVSIARSFAARLDAIGVAVAAAEGPGTLDPAEAAELAAAAQGLPPVARIVEAPAEDRLYSASTFFAIGMAVFFLFFTVEFGVRGLLEEREDGTLARLLVAPIPPTSILAGKGLASLTLGLVSTTLLVIASTVLLDATWGLPLGVASLVLAGVFTAVAVTAFASTLAKTPAQAGTYASLVAVVGGLLGGTFFPISQAPGALAWVRFLSPQGWLMDGFETLASGGTLAEALPAIAGTLAIGIVTGTLAWTRARGLLRG